MKSFFTFLKSFFIFKGVRKGDNFFDEWDLIEYPQLKDYFQVSNNAIKNGESNSPSTDSITPDPFHNNLAARYEQITSTKKLELINSLDSLESGAERALEEVEFIDDVSSNLEIELNRELEIFEPILRLNNSNVDSLKTELEDFKRKNNLSRDAYFPESRWLYFAILAIVLSVESLVNAQLFAAGSELGLLGGLTIAFLISSVNVIISFLVGTTLGKNIFSVNLFKKRIGYFSLAIWSIFVLFFNMTVGHIRSAYEKGFSEDVWTLGFMNTFSNFPTNVFALDNFLSWILVFIGILCSIIALVDGYKIDDEYPGYGSITRKFITAEENRILEINNLNNNAESYCQKFQDSGDIAVQNIGQQATSLRSNYDFSKNRIEVGYPDYCNYFSNSFSRLIEDYRNINIETRQDNPPDYFKIKFNFSYDEFKNEGKLNTLDLKIKEIRNKQEEVTQEWLTKRADLDSIKDKFLLKIRSYDSIS